jgi:hypothetical protein
MFVRFLLVLTHILVIFRPVSHTSDTPFITFAYEKWNSLMFSYIHVACK